MLLDDADSPNKEELLATGTSSSPIERKKIPAGLRQRHGSALSLIETGERKVEWGRLDRSASMSDAELTKARRSKLNLDPLDKVKRKRIVSPRGMSEKLGDAVVSNDLKREKWAMLASTENIQPRTSTLGDIKEEDLHIFARIGNAAKELEELRGKCVKGLKGDIKGKMREHISEICMGADLLIAKHGTGKRAEQADARITTATNKRIAALEQENSKLKTQMSNLKREMEALRIKRDAVYSRSIPNSEQERPSRNLTYAQAMEVSGACQERKLNERDKEKPCVIRTEIIQRGGKDDRMVTEGNAAVTGVTEVQLQRIVCAVVQALKADNCPKPERMKDPNPPLPLRKGHKEEPLIREIMRSEMNKSRQDRAGKAVEENTNKISTDSSAPESSGEETEGSWKVQRKRRGRKRKKSSRNKENVRDTRKYTERNADGNKRIKPPRTAAVIIKCKEEEGGTYTDTVQAMEGIDLKALGISGVQMRNGRNGGIILQIARSNGGTYKAERLMQEICKVVPPHTRVACPTRRLGLKLTGFYELTTAEEIAKKIGDIAKIDPGKIAVGKISTNRGVGSVIIHMPMEEALVLTNRRDILIGLTRVRVIALEPRRIQCFRCLQFGHIRSECKSQEDRSGLCYNCGRSGHKATKCTGEANCPICGPDVKKHRMGSKSCRRTAERANPAGGCS